MRVKSSLLGLTIKALAESMDVSTMVKLVQKVLHNYDLYKRTGFPVNIPIPNRDAARQIAVDIKHHHYFPQFIKILIDLHYKGMNGRKYNIPYLREIIREMHKHGLIYDQTAHMFVEDDNRQRTRNWGVFREGEERVFAFLRIDIVNNSGLVKKYSPKIISQTYHDLRKIVQNAVYKNNGRFWCWEGDGGLVAFHFGNKDIQATLSAMEIIHEIFFYNLFDCKLDEPLKIRIAIHDGSCEYSHKEENIKKNETVKHVMMMEAKYTKPNSFTISDMVHAMLDPIMVNKLKRIESNNRKVYYNYEMKWEK